MHYFGTTHSIFTALHILCALPMYPSYHPKYLSTTSLFYWLYMFVISRMVCSQNHTVGILKVEGQIDWTIRHLVVMLKSCIFDDIFQKKVVLGLCLKFVDTFGKLFTKIILSLFRMTDIDKLPKISSCAEKRRVDVFRPSQFTKPYMCLTMKLVRKQLHNAL